MVASAASGDCKGSETRGLRVAPGHPELATTALARHGTRSAVDRLPATAAGAHGVTIAPVARQADGVGRSRDDAPGAGRTVDHLQESGRHCERPPAYFDDCLERPELRDAIPRAATQPDVQVGLQTSPHARHIHILGRASRANDILTDPGCGVLGHTGGTDVPRLWCVCTATKSRTSGSCCVGATQICRCVDATAWHGLCFSAGHYPGEIRTP